MYCVKPTKASVNSSPPDFLAMLRIDGSILVDLVEDEEEEIEADAYVMVQAWVASHRFVFLRRTTDCYRSCNETPYYLQFLRSYIQ